MSDSQGQQFTHEGYRFELEIKYDDGMREPWVEHDGHGIISEWRRHGDDSRGPRKRAGERELCSDGRSFGYKRFYDFKATVELATKDSWGIGIDDEADLARKLGRMPTPREITVEAVERDFKYMQAWCNNEWWWVYAVVHLLDVNGARTPFNSALGGIESCDEGYIEREVMRELADNIIDDIDGVSELVERTVLKQEEEHDHA